MGLQVEIDVDDYLSDRDKAAIARDAFRAVCDRTSRDDFERILSNAAYELVRKEVDAVFDGGMAATVKAKALHVIEHMPALTVFQRPNAWDREASKAWAHLQSAMDEAQPLIRARVDEVIAGISLDDMHDIVVDRVGVAIISKLMEPSA